MTLSSSYFSINYSWNLDFSFPHLNHPQWTFVTLCIQGYFSRRSTWNKLSLFESQSLIYLLFALTCQWINWHIPHLTLFSLYSSIPTYVSSFDSTSDFFRHAWHANPGADQKWAELISYILIHLLWKLLNTFVSLNISLRTSRSWYSSRFCILKSPQALLIFYI